MNTELACFTFVVPIQYYLQVEDSEAPRIREKVIAIRQVVHLRNQEEVSKRWTFEESVSLIIHVELAKDNISWEDIVSWCVRTYMYYELFLKSSCCPHL